MMDLKALKSAVEQLVEERGLPSERVLSVIEDALAAAYKKDYGKKSQIIRAKFDPQTGGVEFWQVKTVVDESMIHEEKEAPTLAFNEEHHIKLEDARKIKNDVLAGEELTFPLPLEEHYGRIAAQTAKQVILQRLREAEKQTTMEEFAGRAGQIVAGKVQRLEHGNIFVDLGRATGLLSREEQLSGEYYRQGERIKAYLSAVEETPRGVNLRLSRAHPKFVEKLFEVEVPEMANGLVEVKALAREPGSRTKIAVFASAPNIDPVGACVPGRTPILTEDFSYRPIVKLSPGAAVITHTGNIKRVTKVFRRNWAGAIYRFYVFGIHESLDFTGEHPLLCMQDPASAEKFLPASTIFRNKTQFLAIPTIVEVVGDKTIHYFEREKDFLWVLGMYLAEGSLDAAEVNFTLSHQEGAKAEKIKTVMEKYGGKIVVKERSGRPSVIDACLFGYYWRDIFKELGGQYCDRKRIHPRLLVLPPELQMAIFKGWADGDGHRNKARGRLTVVTTSETLLRQMYHILLRNKIRGNMQRRKDKKDRKPAFVLEVAKNKTRDYRGFFRGGYYFSRIRKVARILKFNGGQVYNLEVEGDNSYIVNSVAVHNCVGQRGVRVNTVINEVGGEKIDIMEWSDDQETFITNALSPAKIRRVTTYPEENRAEVEVEPDQFSLAVGRGGQNARLAAKLTGWKIDIISPEEEER